MPTPSPNLFLRFWRSYLATHWALILVIFVLMMIEGSTLAALSYAIQPLFDTVLAQGGGQLFLVGFAIFALFALRGVTSVISRSLIAYVSQKVSVAMQTDLLAHLLTLDSPFFQTHPPGVLIERVQGDTLAVQGVWSSLLIGIGRDFLSLISLFAVALSIDAKWTLAALIGAPILILPAALLQRYIRRKSNQLREQAGLRATRLDEIFHGIQAVKLNRMEAYQASRFRQILGRIVSAEIRSATGRAMMPATVDIVTGLGFFAVLLMAGDQIASGARTTGEFMSFFTAMALTFHPLRRLSELSGVWQVAAASLVRIHALLDTPPSTRRPATSAQLPSPGAPELRFEGVSFAHADLPVLQNLSFTAEAGQTTALVGASGAGKSTVFHLLTGLLDPNAGQIMIGGIDCATLSLADQRGLFATVTQDAALFDETLLENLTLGQLNIASEAIENALETAQVNAFLPLLPDGVDTQVGPRGSGLSGGQRQRVGIARALLRAAPVLLLDEATSALDAGAEAAVAAALTTAALGRTTLVIAHRLATVRHAHKIIVLDQGRVAEQGTHAELLANNGLYARLHRLQIKG